MICNLVSDLTCQQYNWWSPVVQLWYEEIYAYRFRLTTIRLATAAVEYLSQCNSG